MEWVCQTLEDWIGQIAKGISKGLKPHIHELQRGLVALAQQKFKKEKIEVEKKKKILTKLVVGKEDKGFDVAECQLVNDTLGNEFLGCFPFGDDPLPSVSIDVHCFKKDMPTLYIVHSRISIRMRLKKISHNIISLTPKCPFLRSLRTRLMPTISFLASQRSGRIFKTINFDCWQATRNYYCEGVSSSTHNSLYFLFYGVQWEFQNNNLKVESHFLI